MEDKLLKMFFEFERWEYAIAKGIVKDVPKATLYQLCKPEVRTRMYKAIKDGQYEIAPPHTALIPKDTPGEFRTVYVNEAADRVLLSIANDMLFELTPDKVHPSCKSYLKGVGCGKVVQEASLDIARSEELRVKSEESELPNDPEPLTLKAASKREKSDARISSSEWEQARPKVNPEPESQPSAIRHQTFVGWKSDLSKYFDSVPIRYIDAAFDMVEERYGKSALIDVIRKYYHSDWYIDGETKQVCQKYQSLKQGCSVASWLADVLLYHIDDKLSQLEGYYVRYSDDMLFIGPDAEKAMRILKEELAAMEMKLNPKKVEWLDSKHWFKFLGFSIRGKDISLSSTRIKRFQKEIEKRTIRWKKSDGRVKKHQPSSFIHQTSAAISRVNRYLYHGDGQGHSWATGILGVVNVRQDIDTLNAFVMDCIRAVHTGKTKLGGLGYDRQGKTGCVVRGKGRNVSANRRKTGDDIGGYISLGCMQDAIRTSRAAYDTLVRSLSLSLTANRSTLTEIQPSAISPQTSVEALEAAYGVYKHSIPSEKTMHRTSRFYALPESELSDDDMLYGVKREDAEQELEKALAGFTMPEGSGWFWQSENDPDLVVLRQWTRELTADERFQRAMVSIEDVA